MSKDRVKGIIIQLGGDTAPLKKGLNDLNKSINSTQSELKDVERLLKLDPKNTELLRQKQKLLGEEISQTSTKLQKLKEVNEKAAESAKKYDAWKAAYDPIQQKITSTEQKLQSLKATQQSMGNIKGEGYNQLQAEIKETEQQLDALHEAEKKVKEEFGKPISPDQLNAVKREVIETEQKLKGLQDQARHTDSALDKLGAGASKVASVSGNISRATAPVTAAIAAAGIAAVKTASDMDESINKVDVAFKRGANAVKAFSNTTLDTYGIAKGTALDMAALYGDMATSMGQNERQAVEMSTSLVGLAGDLASFKNIGLDQAATALESVFTGETESLKKLGVVMTQTNLDSFAMANGFKKTTEDMTEAEKVQLRYAFVMDKTKNAQGDFARTSDGAANSSRVLAESTKELAASFGSVILPALIPIIQSITDVIKRFAQLDDGTKKTIITILLLTAAISPIAGVVSAASGAIGGVIRVINMLGGASKIAHGTVAALSKGIGALTSPIGLVVAAIIALVALLAIKGDEIKEILEKVDAFLQGIFATDWCEVFGPVLGNAINAFLANFKGIWDSAKQTLEGLIDFIQGVFSGNWEQAWQGIVDIFAGLMNGLFAIVEIPLNLIIGALNTIIDGINWVTEKVNSLSFKNPFTGGTVGFNVPTLGKLPYLAKGGTLSYGSAIVGEEGPELLTVLQNGAARVTPLTGSAGGASVFNTTQAETRYEDNRVYHFTVSNLSEFTKIQQRMEMERQSIRMGYIK